MKKKFQNYLVSKVVNLEKANQILNEEYAQKAGKYTFIQKKYVAWILDKEGNFLSYTSSLKESDLLENHQIYLMPRYEEIDECFEVAA